MTISMLRRRQIKLQACQFSLTKNDLLYSTFYSFLIQSNVAQFSSNKHYDGKIAAKEHLRGESLLLC